MLIYALQRVPLDMLYNFHWSALFKTIFYRHFDNIKISHSIEMVQNFQLGIAHFACSA